jgi:tRNA(Arg) A34 adenosine deaminase TadA
MSKNFMDAALEEAKRAAERQEVPVGAVVVHNNKIIARAGNRTLELNDPSAHAEVLAIREACEKLDSQRLHDCDLYVTLEPCTMCAALISFARIRRLYLAAEDTKGGGVLNGVAFFDQSTCHHAPEIYSGMQETASGELLRAFFKERRSE